MTSGPGGAGRVHVSFSACEPFDCASHGPPAAVPVEALQAEVTATTAALQFHQVGDGDLPVLGYEARLTRIGKTGNVDVTMLDFARWTPLPGFAPGPPDTTNDVSVDGLVPDTEYAAGVVAHGRCGDSPVSYARFHTPRLKYVQLRGCFIATAAFGSPLAEEVDGLRRARDHAVAASSLARAAADLYYGAGPAAARALEGTSVGRAVVRRALAPIASIADALL
jgi:hypothetical protein